ncbi:MAG: hypothetical protein ACOVKS_00075, partial [Aquimonas sp.]
MFQFQMAASRQQELELSLKTEQLFTEFRVELRDGLPPAAAAPGQPAVLARPPKGGRGRRGDVLARKGGVGGAA